MRRTAVIAAADTDDVDRTDLSDPALNSDLDKPKTLLPHEDVEPSSMIVQPVGESEPALGTLQRLALSCTSAGHLHAPPPLHLQACP